MFELTPFLSNFFPAASHHAGDKRLADGRFPTVTVNRVEHDSDLSVAVSGHQGLELDHLLMDPQRFRRDPAADLWRFLRALSSPRCTVVGPLPAQDEDEH